MRLSDYERWRFDGQPIGSLVRDSVCWFLRRSRPDFGVPFDRRVYRDFLVAGAEIALLSPRLLDATRPDVVLELNGQFFAERILGLREELSALEGLLPICSYCKRIRDADGAYGSLEGYIEQRSGAEFTHGICPDCYEKHVRPQLER